MGKKSKHKKSKSAKQIIAANKAAGMRQEGVSLPSVRAEDYSDFSDYSDMPEMRGMPGRAPERGEGPAGGRPAESRSAGGRAAGDRPAESRSAGGRAAGGRAAEGRPAGAGLPEKFRETMKDLLGDDYEAFIRGSGEARHYGLRVNPLKISPEEYEKRSPFHLKKIPWVEGGYYYEADDHPGKHPDYAAGLYYLQEPSAMTPASRLPVKPGHRVLDLCAAPGGKATALGAALQGEGLLVANDINRARAGALLHNIELFGIPNAVIFAEAPYRLAKHFPEFFDRIMVDAPCSGEGMFRKNPAVIDAWKEKGPDYFSVIQKEIVLHAADMLRPGGMMLYSTCTFSPEENESVICGLLRDRPEMEVVPMEDYEGFSPGITSFRGSRYDDSMKLCRRIWPHRMGGEGHFLALLRKKGCGKPEDGQARTMPSGGQARTKPAGEQVRIKPEDGKTWPSSRSVFGYSVPGIDPDQKASMEEFFGHFHGGDEERDGNRDEGRAGDRAGNRAGGLFADFSEQRVEIRRGGISYLSGEIVDTAGLECLRRGLYIGQLKKKRFEPAQALAIALKGSQYDRIIDIPADDERLTRYLRGESFPVASQEGREKEKGWYLVLADGYPLGFGKLTGGILKNKYPAGWRRT